MLGVLRTFGKEQAIGTSGKGSALDIEVYILGTTLTVNGVWVHIWIGVNNLHSFSCRPMYIEVKRRV